MVRCVTPTWQGSAHMIPAAPALAPAVRPISPRSRHRPFPSRLATGALILCWAGLNLAYLTCDCPLELAPDEAHYWDWSRHLDWSYYSKGPLVAWLIRASCELLGGWSQSQIGSEMLAVRIPAILCGSLLLLTLYELTGHVYGCVRDECSAAAVL